jgi:hypothetical protein
LLAPGYRSQKKRPLSGATMRIINGDNEGAFLPSSFRRQTGRLAAQIALSEPAVV